ncbi:hypothetical protein PHYSODRAFT_512004 [Phytophthora sojae]|uniref:Uncharacterized protein n=1 Tax=Phytophthora sojae (strain P6497) TaxID=1094619 RepID=G4ZQT4_PHYSP|nr:hypothetical protein PHYSODRAFT_512004 [Phytophthora sojae]EGZ13882.1 hypothetical protein PHYSODRAFT_512004 [Phytophthora sojae]|eukprot:XP_009531311.1 hypothetical protein PHYSODRAFT_512004 [Phytophthora sojae]
MADDAYYRQVVAQMQGEFQRALQALEKQAEDAARREQALAQELAALKRLLQQEQDYWARHDQAGKEDRDRLTQQLAQAQADALQRREQNRALRNEMRALQSRVDTAVATSHSFEQRLLVVVQEKQQSAQEMEAQLVHYKKKLHEKRAQNKYLTQALVRLQEQRQKSSDSSSSGYGSPVTTPVEVPAPAQQRRVRKREMGLTLPEEIKAAAANVTTSSRMYKSKRMGSSRAGTSPTSSSPEISPRSARSAPYKRAPSVATTTPTASDGNSFNSNSSSGSLRSMRSLRHVTGRRITSRNSSDSDNIDVSPRTSAGHLRASPTGRLERELSGLRRKLDSCMADAAARW